MLRVYMTAPLSAPTKEGIAANIARAKRWYKWIATNFEVAVVADWILCVELLDDQNENDREYGLACDLSVVEVCNELWHVGGRISAGAALEGDHADEMAVKRVDLTFLGDEPPVGVPEVLRYLAPLRQAPAPSLRIA